jgi:hypothetical protein
MGFLTKIPPPVREYLPNLMLFGLWHSSITPPVDILLTKIVHPIRTLMSFGIDMFFDKGKQRDEDKII